MWDNRLVERGHEETFINGNIKTRAFKAGMEHREKLQIMGEKSWAGFHKGKKTGESHFFHHARKESPISFVGGTLRHGLSEGEQRTSLRENKSGQNFGWAK